MKRLLVRVALVVALLAVPLLAVALPAQADAGAAPVLIAHRGAHSYYAENSLNAFRAAAAGGVLTWETDVRFTRSNVPYLMHDATLDRTTTCHGEAAVKSFKWLNKHCRLRDGQHVPSLWKFVALAKSLKATPLIEIKTGLTAAERAAVVHRLTALGMTGRVVMQDFNAARLAYLGKATSARLALLSSTPIAGQAVLDSGADTVCASRAVITADAVDAWHVAGLVVWAWTPNRLVDVEAVVDAGVDGVITDQAVLYAGGDLRRP